LKRWNLLIITVFAVSIKVAAYGPNTTHPLMGERSVNLLKDDFPGNYENIDQAAINAIRSGNKIRIKNTAHIEFLAEWPPL